MKSIVILVMFILGNLSFASEISKISLHERVKDIPVSEKKIIEIDNPLEIAAILKDPDSFLGIKDNGLRSKHGLDCFLSRLVKPNVFDAPAYYTHYLSGLRISKILLRKIEDPSSSMGGIISSNGVAAVGLVFSHPESDGEITEVNYCFYQ